MVIVEGILIFENAEVRDLMDIKIFVDTDADVRILRRVLRVLPVAVGCKSSDELALPLLGLHGTFDLVGNIPGILLVKHILEGKQHVIRAIFTVNVVVDRQKAHSMLREPAFQVAA